MSLGNALKWRYSVKKYSNKKVTSVDLNTIIETINLSASSAGLQPYRVIVVEDPQLRAKLGESTSFNPQITESSHLLIFAAIDNLSTTHVDEYMQRIAHTRNLPVESLDKFRQILVANITSKTSEENLVWAAKQAYIGLGTAIAAASELQVDTTPMEGFVPSQFDEILGFKEQGLKSVVLLALGYRDTEKDPYASAAKVRLSLEEFSTTI